MKTQITQKVNSFDTLNLTIPGDVINRTKRNYSSDLQVNEETMEIMNERYGADAEQIKFNRDKKKHLGLGHCIYVPHRDIYDISISAKILRDKYPIGITRETIYDVIQELENYGIGDIEPEAFIKHGEIRSMDNTFNIEIDNCESDKDIYQMFDAISCISAVGIKQKIRTFEADGTEFGNINGVVIKKDTKQNQQITFYYKIDEAFSGRGNSRNNAKEVISRKYGMNVDDFYRAFQKSIRVELRLQSQVLLKKAFNLPNSTRDNVVLSQLLNSKSNAMLKKFDEFVSHKQTEKGMLAIEKKRTIKNVMLSKPTGSGDKMDIQLRLWATALYDIIEMTDGDYKTLCTYVRNEWYNGKTLNNASYEKIQILVKLYQNRNKNNDELGVLVKKYKEMTKKIKQLV